MTTSDNFVVQTASLQRNLGQFIAIVDKAMASLDMAAFHRTHAWDMCQSHKTIRTVLHDIQGLITKERVDLILQAAEMLEMIVCPQQEQLRRQLIHSDANEANVLVDSAGEKVRYGCFLNFAPVVLVIYFCLNPSD